MDTDSEEDVTEIERRARNEKRSECCANERSVVMKSLNWEGKNRIKVYKKKKSFLTLNFFTADLIRGYLLLLLLY